MSKYFKKLESSIISITSSESEELKKDHVEITNKLSNLFKVENLICLFGSGASIYAGMPRMNELLEIIKENKSKLPNNIPIGDKNENNIEDILSELASRSEIANDSDKLSINEFLKEVVKQIAVKCGQTNINDVVAHESFLSRIIPRGDKANRVKVFTTNYDLCIEIAAQKTNKIIIDGFTFSYPRVFNPRNYQFDIYFRNDGEAQPKPSENCFYLYKIHGSINWDKDDDSKNITMTDNPKNYCMIYPSSNKYKMSYQTPYSEMMAQFQFSLRRQNTCLVVIGFSFTDNHIWESIKNALKQDTSFSLIVVNYFDNTNETQASNSNFDKLLEIAKENIDDRIMIINAKFEEFSKLIPAFDRLSKEEHKLQKIGEILEK